MDEIECPWCRSKDLYQYEDGRYECQECGNIIPKSYVLWLLSGEVEVQQDL
jgi:transcription initiation factor TFIIIB Brf1 subunit/transcription initiation factor TFIIB